VDIIDAGTMDDPHATIEGLRSIRTAAGDCVNRIAKGSYQIVTHGDEPDVQRPCCFLAHRADAARAIDTLS